MAYLITLIHQILDRLLKVAYSPIYKYSLPEGHRFPMIKYELLAEQLLYEGTIQEMAFFEPAPLTETQILRTHTLDYWNKLKDLTITPKEARRIGFPMSAHLVKRGTVISNGTIGCALNAMEHGVSLNIAGGTHHAFTDRGEGFCLLNDIAIATHHLLYHKLAHRILIVDLDVHQGNGTAQIFAKEPGVFTFSMHGANNYPLQKEASDLDLPMPDQTENKEYLRVLQNQLPQVLDTFKPDFVFYLSGVDVLASDKLGRLALTMEGCAARDRLVFEECCKRDLPIAVSMGGGYSERVATIVDAHANTFRIAKDVYF